MRLKQLELIRYGHFTDETIELPADDSDIHLIFGPNEAGKSTALSALGDLFFGVPTKSLYGFLHDYSSMLIGARIQNETTSLEFHRRKGQRNTLLNPDASPIAGGESALHEFLAGADRNFFERMFSLDHQRLQAGGQDILAAKDDVGQMLFSAGSGLSGLRSQIDKLNGEADALWGPRRAGHRRYAKARERLDEANQQLRQEIVTAKDWNDKKRNLEEAETLHAEIEQEIRASRREQSRIARVRRVYGDLHKLATLKTEISETRPVKAMPDNASKDLEKKEREDLEATNQMTALEAQLVGPRQELEQLPLDARYLHRAQDVRLLDERRIEIRSGRADLPKRRTELNAAEQNLLAWANELEWSETSPDAIMAKVPTQTKIGRVSTLLRNRERLVADRENQIRQLQDARTEGEKLEAALEDTSELSDVSRLGQVIRVVQEKGDLDGQLSIARSALAEKTESVEKRISELRPLVPDEQTLSGMAIPVREQIVEFRDRRRDLEQRMRETRRRVKSLEQNVSGNTEALNRTIEEERIVTDGQLAEARRFRDNVWAVLKYRHLLGRSAPEVEDVQLPDDPISAFEPAMEKADNLADLRFDHAEAAARIKEKTRALSDMETELELAREGERELKEEWQRLEINWADLWSGSSVEPLAPPEMLEWLETRGTVLQAIEERQRQQRALDATQQKIRLAREQLIGELVPLGFDACELENEDLNLVVLQASDALSRHRNEAEQRERSKGELQTARNKEERLERELARANEAMDKWQADWRSALRDIGLGEDTLPDTVDDLITIIGKMQDISQTIRTLKNDRIDKIVRDIEDFENEAKALATELSPELTDEAADKLVLTLVERVDDAERIRQIRHGKEQEIERLSERLKELQGRRDRITAEIAPLKHMSGADTIDELKEIIRQSDLLRERERAKEELLETLRKNGDGKSTEELEQECKGIDFDEIGAMETSIISELEELQQKLTNAAEVRLQARDAFNEIGGDDSTAQTAAKKEEALAELQEVASQYIQSKTSALLLKWAIDRYRQEKQAPMLERAGRLFSILTRDSFVNLRISYDSQDRATLVGIRPNGSNVPVAGMSSGTADQLYLALRIASIEEYLDRASALPFVADDLFINFDDERASAGFRLLGDLSKKTQVLFFTHHQHLVDIARDTLGDGTHLVQLGAREAAAAFSQA